MTTVADSLISDSMVITFLFFLAFSRQYLRYCGAIFYLLCQPILLELVFQR